MHDCSDTRKANAIRAVYETGCYRNIENHYMRETCESFALHAIYIFIAFLKSWDRLDKVGNLLPGVVIEVYKVEVHVVATKKKLVRIFDAPDNKRSDKLRSTVWAQSLKKFEDAPAAHGRDPVAGIVSVDSGVSNSGVVEDPPKREAETQSILTKSSLIGVILTEAYGDETLSRAHVFECHKQLSEGGNNVEDDVRSGCPRGRYHGHGLVRGRRVMSSRDSSCFEADAYLNRRGSPSSPWCGILERVVPVFLGVVFVT
ncbi:hypothetical protein TNCV_1611161 [Trichonephila clavipes]|nr:hypothetical protein TNCV_1611161 [Trichonephila clavipes]